MHGFTMFSLLIFMPAAAGDFGFKELMSADPAADNVVHFQRCRQTVLQHDSISVLAAMGRLTPGITGKLPGYSGWGQISAELANCSPASMASLGVSFQDGSTDSARDDQANYSASPPRTFESELGLHAPAGSLDSAGSTADGSVANFQQNRPLVLQHGRPGPSSRCAPVATASAAGVIHAPATFEGETGHAAKMLGDASCDFAKEVDWNSGIFLQVLGKFRPLEVPTTISKMSELEAAADPTLLADAAEAQHKALGSIRGPDGIPGRR